MRQIRLCLLVLVVSALSFAASETQWKRTPPPESPMAYALEFNYGQVSYESFATGLGTVESVHMGVISFEWMPVINHGKLSLGASFGFGGSSFDTHLGTGAALMVAHGSTFVSYHLDFFPKQVVVPYAKIARGMVYAREELNDGKIHKRTLPLFQEWSVGGGIEFNLNWIEPRGARTLDKEYGINNVYLMLEYLKSNAVGTQTAINLETSSVRAGLRFEF